MRPVIAESRTNGDEHEIYSLAVTWGSGWMTELNIPNVLMIMVDSLRPDRLGCGGNPEAQTPNIDRIAQSGVMLERAFCPMPSSAPSRASIMTGRFPHSHGLRVNDAPLNPDEHTLAESLSQAGFVAGATPKMDRGLERGFHQVWPASPGPGLSNHLPGGQAEHITSRITDAAIEWMAERGQDPWFLWVDYESTHEPWRPPKPFDTVFDPGYSGRDVSCPRMYEPEMTERERRHLMALYDGEVAFVDLNIGRLSDALAKLGLSDNTITILVGDHGVFLGEHFFCKKPPFLFDPLMRTAVMFSWPGVLKGNIKLYCLAQICDVMPTLLDLLNLPVPRSCHGATLADILRGSKSKIHDAVFMEFCEYRGTAIKAVRTCRWKYIYHRSIGNTPWSGDYSPGEVFATAGLGREMLFDLAADPSEATNLANDRPEVCSEMKNLLLDSMVDSEDG